MSLNPIEVIKKKRNGGILTAEEIHYFITSYLGSSIPDYQMSSLLMAVYFQGLNDYETFSLINEFINSGQVVDLSGINKPKIDKHSTGGVGDKTSIILAPLLSSLDVAVPMVSGRGLGYTGGTLDKLESIPGFKVDLTIGEFKEILKKTNVCMMGQTDEVVPADKRIYALRDVTATIDNIGLITASIVSKKVAEGADGIVYDIKIGSGANIPDEKSSRELANKLLFATRKFGKKALAVLTDMNEPLGYAVGNWFEIEECISIMNPLAEKSSLSEDLFKVTITLAGAMLFLAGKCMSIEDGMDMAQENITNGQCYRKFIDMVKIQGGDTEFITNKQMYPKQQALAGMRSIQDGYISKLDARNFGLASVVLGCGRRKIEDKIDHTAGIIMNKKVGDQVNSGEIICGLFGANMEKVESARNILQKGIQVSNSKVGCINKIIEIID
jgi:pyrimidine-nucleoside phosphorylase